MAVILDSIMEGAQRWPLEERRELILAVSEYSQFGIEPDLDELSPMVAGTFVMLRPALDTSSKRSESGAKGGRKRAENARSKADSKQAAKQAPSEAQANAKQSTKQTSSKAQANLKQAAKQNPSEEEEEEELKKPSADALGKERRRRFVPPTVEEVDAYIAERGYGGFTGQQFVDHYEANGWMRGRSRVKDWRACVRTWANQRARGPRGQPPSAQPLPDFSAYDLVEEAI